ncbi:peroxiredoxin [Novosphingobium capsulatum]|uniref:Peroxiredoxin n=1 Tax=Novosphingobium capsulatum TaxID=13688 RepID=A0ABU1MNV2_9SPHN|nr:peroxiredoxin-like family protein [Novosphingobium capsulatum]MDR6512006.1 peroxiredoxin [Novosphingobium capsulatum]
MPETASLSERYAALLAERARTWPAEQLAGNARQRQVLVERYDRAAHPAVGTRLASFTLLDAQGQPRRSEDLLRDGPVVLVFFRFGGCPACNLALPYYDATLWPALQAAGVALYAVSAQNPVDPGPSERHGLRFATLADPDYALARQLGITFFPEDQPAVAPGAPWIGATLGTHSYEMTQPAIVIINADHTLRYLAVSPDWLDRPEAAAILAQLPEVNEAGGSVDAATHDAFA